MTSLDFPRRPSFPARRRAKKVSSFTTLRNLWRRYEGAVELPSACAADAPAAACAPACDLSVARVNASVREAMWSAAFDWTSPEHSYGAEAQVCNVMQCHGMQWNAMECNGMEWNEMEYNGMHWNTMECNGM